MKLADWARLQGIDYKTAYRWFRAGILPVPSRQLPTGTILVQEESVLHESKVALYARVPSHDQKPELERQIGRVCEYASKAGLVVSKCVAEIGSGLNGHRPKLLGLLRDKTIGTILVEHRDRLARFGSEYIEAALNAQGRKLVVVDPGEMQDDLVEDMVSVLTSFCARLYGHRSAKTRARKALEALES